MKIIRSKKKLTKEINNYSNIGFVATMGFLHEGHLSLVRQSKKENQITIVSIFVNPLQFGKNEDFESYPHDEKRDLSFLEQEFVDIVFIPEKDFYHANHQTMIQNDIIKKKYCGATRKQHFDGVLTVVAKFFNLIKPTVAYFGEKDFQQFFLIKKMAIDLDFSVEVKNSPTIREKNGLAMSSRNSYFSEQQKQQANFLYDSLLSAKQKIIAGEEISRILKNVIDEIKSFCYVEYIVLVDEENLMEVSKIEAKKNYRLLIAVQYCSVRLIDNLALKI